MLFPTLHKSRGTVPLIFNADIYQRMYYSSVSLPDRLLVRFFSGHLSQIFFLPEYFIHEIFVDPTFSPEHVIQLFKSTNPFCPSAFCPPILLHMHVFMNVGFFHVVIL